MRQIENAVKAMGQGSEELLKLLEECPQGAESLVARIVHLLTERGKCVLLNRSQNYILCIL